MRNSQTQGHLKLLVEAINILLDRSMINWSPLHLSPPAHGHIIVELAGHPSAIVWHDVGYGELSISVWWQFDFEAYLRRKPLQASFATTLPTASRTKYPKLVGATASLWLERKSGLFIQGSPARLFDVYTRKGLEKELSELPLVEPKGFKTSGPFYL